MTYNLLAIFRTEVLESDFFACLSIFHIKDFILCWALEICSHKETTAYFEINVVTLDKKYILK